MPARERKEPPGQRTYCRLHHQREIRSHREKRRMSLRWDLSFLTERTQDGARISSPTESPDSGLTIGEFPTIHGSPTGSPDSGRYIPMTTSGSSIPWRFSGYVVRTRESREGPLNQSPLNYALYRMKKGTGK